MQILVAPNAFKNSLTASEAAFAIKKGFEESLLECTCRCFPIADGGDGTSQLITELLQGSFIRTLVQDPFGRIIPVQFGLINEGTTAVIDIAAASGIRLLSPNELNPLKASTYGTGQLIKIALDKGIKKIIIGVGGSATVDGGAGILEALGVRFLDEEGNNLKAIPENFERLFSLDLADLDYRIKDTEFVVLCDVKNPLLGETGAAKVFGPQKGASIQQIEILEAGLAQLAKSVERTTACDISSINYGGAAGGSSAGLYAILNARLVSGIDEFLSLTDFESALETVDLVITGEGSMDEQTLEGKGPYGVAAKARSKSIPVIGLAGKIPLSAILNLQQYFNILLPINYDNNLEVALKQTAENLTQISKQLGNLIMIEKKSLP